MKQSGKILLLFVCTISGLMSYAQTWQWLRESTGPVSEGTILTTDLSNNIIACGFGSDNMGFGSYNLSSPNSLLTAVVKYDPSGNVIWARNSMYGNSTPTGIATDENKNIYLYGYFRSDSISFGTYTLYDTLVQGNFPHVFYLVKFDSSGNIQWLRSGAHISDYPPVTGMAADKTGNTYITGSFTEPSITFGAYTLSNTVGTGSSNDLFVVKYDPSGNVLWAKSASGTGDEFAQAIAVTKDGDVYVSGSFSDPLSFGSNTLTAISGNTNLYLAKFDASGNIKWAKSASGYTAQVYSLACDSKSNVYITGNIFGTVVFGSQTITNPSLGFSNPFLVKYDSAGNALWAKNFPGQGNIGYTSVGFSAAIDMCDNIWICGAMDSTIAFDGHTLNASSISTDPSFIAGFDASGNYLDSRSLPTGGDDNSNITTDALGNIYFGGDDYLPVPFLLGGDSIMHTGVENMFVAKYTPAPCHPEFINEQKINEEVYIYPNPANDILNVNYKTAISQNAGIQIYNITGQLVLASILKTQNTSVSIGQLPQGIYICKITTANREAVTKKILIER